MRFVRLMGLVAAIAFSMSGVNAYAVVSIPAASATIDWSTLSVEVLGLRGNLNPTFSFEAGSQTTNAYIASGPSDYAGDWTTDLSVTSGVVSASASASILNAQFTSHPGEPNNTGQSWRGGGFTIGADTYVIFSVTASVSIDMNAPQGGAAYAWSVLTAEGPDMTGGPDSQSSSTSKLVFANGLGNPQSSSGTLYVSFSNLSGSDITGNLRGEAIVNSYGANIILVPVPEPGATMMLMAGLALVAAVVTRRRTRLLPL